MRLRWALAWALAACALRASLAAEFVEEPAPYPHLEARRVPEPTREFPGSGVPIAMISAIYEVDTPDLRVLMPQIRSRLAEALTLENIAYVETEHVTRLVVNHRCDKGILVCRNEGDDNRQGPLMLAPGVGGMGLNGSLMNADPRTCVAENAEQAFEAANWGLSESQFEAAQEAETVGQWMPPVWQSDNHLQRLVYETELCVNRQNTSLMDYPQVLENLYITGGRRDANHTKVPKDPANGHKLELHVVGRIPVEWAIFFNSKFFMNGSIPLPLYQPEVMDTSATHTDLLNVSIEIIGVRQGTFSHFQSDFLDYMPICEEPPVPMTGCARIDHYVYEEPTLTEYKIRTMMQARKNVFVQMMSDRPYLQGAFNASEGPWPHLEWLVEEEEQIGPWRLRTFPQKESVFQEECRHGAACEQVPMAPSPRHMHSAILYTTWNFEEHARKYLCNERQDCGRDCLTNLTCLNGTNYFQGNFYFRSSQFANDDGGIIPPLGLDDQDCPRVCCKDRRICMRVHDVLGYEVPFQKEMILVFGGKTLVHERDETGRLVYHNCERIPRSDLREEWRSCSELTVNDLWRYDVEAAKWEYIKPDSALSPTTGKPVGYPSTRFGHGAVLVHQVSSNDDTMMQKFMYVYGGLGPQCRGGVCSDVWRYEIPWAAQAYYPKFPDGEWKRGNQWDRMKDCPYGGRYRHAMVVTSGQEYIYVYGGQGLGGFYDVLLRYRLSTDLWEDLNPFGRQSLTRLMYDYRGNAIHYAVPIESYDPQIDVDCANAWRFDGKWAHCRRCPECRLNIAVRADGGVLPQDRGDTAIATFPDTSPGALDDILVMFGGYRTTWGTLRDPEAECQAIITTTTTVPTTTPFVGEVILTEPPTTTAWSGLQTSTSRSDESGVAVVGTFPMLGGVPTTSTTTVTLLSSTVTTTAAMRTVTNTRTTTVSTTTTIPTTATSTTTTVTNTTTTTMDPLAIPTTTVPAPAPASTFPPVEYGGANMNRSRSSQNDQSSQDSTLRVGPELCTQRYYFDDLWIYDATGNQWASQETATNGDVPTARRGHCLIVRRGEGNDTQLVLFGGHTQDRPMSDMWILDVVRPKEERKWTRIDSYFEGIKPPEMSYHSMHYSEALNTVLIFGGLHWRETDLAEADRLRNIDRRCFKQAQGLPASERGKSEAEFRATMRYLCETRSFPGGGDCCSIASDETPGWELGGIMIRTDTGALNLTAISMLCRAECQAESFYPEFYPIMMEGVWEFRTDRCPGNCSGHGRCDMSQCVCEPAWYGIDCSQQICPGTMCYTHPTTKEQSCVECSSHGRCIYGECQCFPGWGYEDCSAVMCPGNCSSTPTETRGVCIEDFPVHTCSCFGRYSGLNCSELLCLNGCTGRGRCDDHGLCQCDPGFFGDDCSLFTIPIMNDVEGMEGIAGIATAPAA